MVEDAVQNIPPVVLRARKQQRLYSNAVREQKDDAEQCEVEKFNHLQQHSVNKQRAELEVK